MQNPIHSFIHWISIRMDVLLIFLFPKEKKTVCSKCVVFNSCCFIFITNHLSLYSKKKKFDQLSINRSIDWFRALEINFFWIEIVLVCKFSPFLRWFYHCKSSFVCWTGVCFAFCVWLCYSWYIFDTLKGWHTKKPKKKPKIIDSLSLSKC